MDVNVRVLRYLGPLRCVGGLNTRGKQDEEDGKRELIE